MPHMSSEVLWSWYAPLPLLCFSKRTQCGDVCFFVFVYFGISYSCTLIPYLALTRKGKEIPFELELINMRQCLIENQEKKRSWHVLPACCNKEEVVPASHYHCAPCIDYTLVLSKPGASRVRLLRGFGKSRRDV